MIEKVQLPLGRVLLVPALIAVTSLLVSQVAKAQAGAANEWIWMSGSSAIPGNNSGQPGVYGTLGVPAAGNVPGSRSGANNWTDSNGSFWFLGGATVNGGELNDLWEFNPTTKEWTWKGGSNTVGPCTTVDGLYTYCGWPGVYGTLGTPAAGNIPGGRDSAVSWFDHNGNVWLFGGQGFDSIGSWGWLNDLWEFNPSTKEWDWVGGSNRVSGNGVYGTLGTPAAGNIPGSRLEATNWVDSGGNLWLFGGFGYDSAGDSGELNDLWEFKPSTKEWTWMAGSNTVSLSGVYGKLGVPAPGNIPGGRNGAVSWTDSSGKIWLFGGYISNSSAQTWGILNDLWEFNPSTKEWTWMSGSGTPFQPGVYGKLGVPAARNVPGSRSGGASWTDSGGNLWLFGGYGDDSNGDNSSLNDLWEFRPSTKEWAWRGGSSTISATYSGRPGVYGLLGTPAAENIPGARSAAANWTDHNGNFWLFGGAGVDSNGYGGLLNDLWVYQLSASTLPQAAKPAFSPAGGTYASGRSVKISDTSPDAAIYYSTNGTAPNAIWTAYSGPIAVTTPETIDAIAMAGGYSTSAMATADYVFLAAAPTFYPPAGTYSPVLEVGIFDAMPATTTYYTTDGSTPTTASPVYGEPIIVSSSETIKAIEAGDGYQRSNVVSATYKLQTATPVFDPPSGTYNAATVTISDATAGATVYFTTNGTAPTTSSPVYSGPIEVSSTETIKAIAGYAGITNSVTGSATYTISPSAPTIDEWNWAGGSSTFWNSAEGNCFANYYCGQPGVYGTLGAAAAGNLPGGREEGATWTDSKGNLWLFGGYGVVNNLNEVEYLNDLWKFSPSTKEWTWVSGSDTLYATGGGCIVGSTSGRQNNCGQPGVYGKLGVPAARNVPGGREFSSKWLDSKGNLWLFGGYGIDANDSLGELNDLWEFDPATTRWTWIAGSNSVVYDGDINIGQPGVYGTLGVAAAGNTPGSRIGAASWTDSSGNLWLFGGSGYDANQMSGNLNDLWKFNPSTHLWAWMGGSNSVQGPTCSYGETGCAQPGVYGVKGVPAAANIPGGRMNANVWSGNGYTVYLFGGFGADSRDSLGYLNDLWAFNPSKNEWTWIGGSNTDGGSCTSEFTLTNCIPSGVYGTLGVPNSANIPGGRHSAVSWTDKSGNLWLFGGTATYMADVFDPAEYTPITAQGNFNDLWEFKIASNEWVWMGGSNGVTGQTVGVYGTPGLPAAGNMPGGRYRGQSWTDGSGELWLLGGWGVDSTGSWFGYLNDLWEYKLVAIPAKITPTVKATPTASNITTAQPHTLTAAVSGDSGNPQPTGTGTLTSGSYTSAVTALSGSLATITVPAGSLNPGRDRLTATYTPNSTSSAKYKSASGTPSVVVSQASVTATPTFSPTAGTRAPTQTVKILDTTAGATIYHSTNEQAPTTASSLYADPLEVRKTTTIKAVTVSTGYLQSVVASVTCTITPQALSPTFSPGKGTYDSVQLVKIADTAATGLVIYHTANGDTLMTSSTKHT